MEEGVLLQWRCVEAAECGLYRFGTLAKGCRNGKRSLEDERHDGRLLRCIDEGEEEKWRSRIR